MPHNKWVIEATFHFHIQCCKKNNGFTINKLADSYVAGAAARKEVKYSNIDGRYLFEPIAIETLGVYSTSAHQLLSGFGRKIAVFRGSQRDELSLPEMFNAGAAFQRSFNAQRFAGL